MIADTMNTKTYRLWKLCQDFIKKHEISCGETIYQTDGVIEDAYGFLEEMCDIVGYKKDPEEDKDRLPYGMVG